MAEVLSLRCVWVGLRVVSIGNGELNAPLMVSSFIAHNLDPCRWIPDFLHFNASNIG